VSQEIELDNSTQKIGLPEGNGIPLPGRPSYGFFPLIISHLSFLSLLSSLFETDYFLAFLVVGEINSKDNSF